VVASDVVVPKYHKDTPLDDVTSARVATTMRNSMK